MARGALAPQPEALRARQPDVPVPAGDGVDGARLLRAAVLPEAGRGGREGPADHGAVRRGQGRGVFVVHPVRRGAVRPADAHGGRRGRHGRVHARHRARVPVSTAAGGDV